jgi:hypothetical protein
MPVARRRLDAPAPLRLWHLASLDAPTVAVVWALGFAWAARVKLPPWVPVLLALVAWTVYIADRLLDARNGLRTGEIQRLRERHFFHHRHRKILGSLAVASACIAAWIVFSLMPAGALERNSLLAAAAVAYFSGVHTSRRLPQVLTPLLSKEFLVGVLFTAACVQPSLSRAAAGPGEPPWPPIAVAAYFAALAWLNCQSIERWESEAAEQTGKALVARKGTSFSPYMNPAKPDRALASEIQNSDNSRLICSSAPAVLLTLAGLLQAAVLLPIEPRTAALVAAGTLSALLLALLDRLRNRFTPLALRSAADLVLLSPALVWPIALLCR